MGEVSIAVVTIIPLEMNDEIIYNKFKFSKMLNQFLFI